MSKIIFEEFDWTRVYGVFFIQSIVIGFFCFLLIKVLKKSKNQLNQTLSKFYICLILAFSLNFIYYPSQNGIVVYVLHLSGSFFIALGYTFLLLFIIKLKNFNRKRKTIQYLIYVYVLIALLLLINPQNVYINADFRPQYSWFFLFNIYLVFTVLISIPSLVFSISIYRSFEDKYLKKQFLSFLLGICGFFIAWYGIVLYNTWDNSYFRAIWSVCSLIVIPSGLLIYYGVGTQISMSVKDQVTIGKEK